MKRGGRGRGPGGFRRDDLTSVKYNADEDLDHLQIWPFDFYYLKPGAKARRTKAEGRTPRSAGLLRKMDLSRFAPLSWDDIAHIQLLVVDVWHLCPSLWVSYMCLRLFEALIPAASLHFQGQLFTIVHDAIEKRELDTTLFLQSVAGSALCSLASRISSTFKHEARLRAHLEHLFGARTFAAQCRLDLPTSTDDTTQTIIQQTQFGGSKNPWGLLRAIISLGTTFVQLVTQVWMLLLLLQKQPQSTWLVLGSFATPALQYIRHNYSAVSYAALSIPTSRRHSVLHHIPRNGSLRKEIVINNLADYLIHEFSERGENVGDSDSADTVWNRYRGTTLSSLTMSLLQDAASEAPRLAFALSALRTPAHIPVSLAALELVQSQVRTFTDLLRGLMSDSESLKARVDRVRQLYSLNTLPNIVKDGYKDLNTNGRGVAVEFDSVSFAYPKQDRKAISNVSFKIQPGSLCILVGGNGQGKSSILKLVARLYDATEGTIRIQDEPIQNFLLSDLRKTTAVLFQDYATFPVSIEENIRLGDGATAGLPFDADQEARVKRAAKLGGADEFISKLPKGYKTNYGERPEVASLTGVDAPDIFSAVHTKNIERNAANALSGGQTQRLALARTFMKPEDKVSLLIYDEPSASLDPEAEYDLFERLKALRGSKTMIFSTHRFGYLTKYADLILYMKDSTIAECGTHLELMEKDGGYAHLYKIQAGAFVD